MDSSEWWTRCPACGSSEVYQAEEDDLNSEYCGGLFNWCDACGHTDLPDEDE